MRKALTVLGIILHIICLFICFFPFGKFISFESGKTGLLVGVIALIVCAVITFLVYFVDVIVAVTKNKSLFNKIKLIVVLLAIPVCFFVLHRGNAGFIVINVYSIVLLAIEIFSLFVDRVNLKK